MKLNFTRSQIALAAIAAISATGMSAAPSVAHAAPKTSGKYVAGDFHNHTTCSDGSISMQKLVRKSTDLTDGNFGLDWFVQAGHGGSGNRNCTLAEDDSLATPAYPVVRNAEGTILGPQTRWANGIPPVTPKGLPQASGNMWRWQALQEFQYPITEYLGALKNKPLFLGLESNAAGHEHTSMSIITGQIPPSLDAAVLPTGPGYTALGNANALSQWTYCFERGVNADFSRGNTTATAATPTTPATTSGVGNNWDCSVTGALNAADPSWNAVGKKLIIASGTGAGDRGHLKTVEAVRWMAEFHPEGSYYVPAHLERAGTFNPNGNNGFNVEHLRNFNTAGPRVAFGMESQPGHGASSDRGEYLTRRNNVNGFRTDSAGGVTFGGTGVYAAYVGGVWDALLGEGRNFWFFASSDWHNRGQFGPDERQSTQDFYPGEYQRNYTMVRNGSDKLRPQTIVDGLRSGNNFAASGQLIDRLAFTVCANYPGSAALKNANVESSGIRAIENAAYRAALNNTDVDFKDCAAMGEKLVVKPGAELLVTIVVRDPLGSSYSPYTFPNPSLMQIGVNQPLDKPVLDHIDVIRGMVTGVKKPTDKDYAGAWPNNWAFNPDKSLIPAAARNDTAAVHKTFNASSWKSDGQGYLTMSYRISRVQESQYVRLRGTNLPASVPFETDGSGNPLRDLETNSASVAFQTVVAPPPGQQQPPEFAENFFLKIKCTTPAGTTEFNGCPSHLPTKTDGAYTGKYSALDVAAWADLWFYSNPIYVEVEGSAKVSKHVASVNAK